MRAMGWLLLVATIFGMAAPANADGWHEFWAKYERNYERTRLWPEPFIHADRKAVRAPWAIMEHNGWRAQNTFTEELFDNDAKLTEAGRRKLVWVATQAPVERRVVYVLATADRTATTARARSMQDAVNQLVEAGVQAPELMMTTRRPLRWSGDYYEQVDQKGRQAIQPPVLPEMVLTTSGG